MGRGKSFKGAQAAEDKRISLCVGISAAPPSPLLVNLAHDASFFSSFRVLGALTMTFLRKRTRTSREEPQAAKVASPRQLSCLRLRSSSARSLCV